MADKFPTESYAESGLPICPNGDQVRSDESGLFCWMDGERVDAEIVNGKVRVFETVLAEKKTTKSKKPAEEGQTDGNG
jgi:hypothetical protein